MTSLNKIGLFYGSSTCYTEMAAEKIRTRIGNDQVDIFNIADINIKQLENYTKLILGIPTWDYGELQEDWESIWDDLNELNLSEAKIALFGLGDQVGYPQWFLDAMGYLHDQMVLCGATLVGYWPNKGYTFEASKALTKDKSHFVGLALDDENEFDLSEARINTWCTDVLAHFNEN